MSSSDWGVILPGDCGAGFQHFPWQSVVCCQYVSSENCSSAHGGGRDLQKALIRLLRCQTTRNAASNEYLRFVLSLEGLFLEQHHRVSDTST